MKISGRTVGTKTLKKLLDEYAEKTGPALESAMYIEAEETITAAKRRTPVDEGHLRNSGFVDIPIFTRNKISVAMGFGGVAGSGNLDGKSNLKPVGYAVHVHENLQAFHKVGQSKYLESVINERRKDYTKRLSKRVRQYVNR